MSEAESQATEFANANPPDLFEPSVMGGVGLTCYGGGREAYLEFREGCATILVLDDYEDAIIERVEPTQIQGVMDRIRSFLAIGENAADKT